MKLKKKMFLKIAAFIGFTVLILFIGNGSLWRIPLPDTKKPENKVIRTESEKISVSRRDSIVSFGTKLLDTPYLEGGSSIKGFDCSGFVYFVFRHFHISVPRSSSQFNNFGKEVSIDSVKKGDILVFLSPTRNVIGHVGIVTKPNGLETEFIHSSSGPEMKVIVTSLKNEGYTRRFVKAVNVLGEL